MKKKASQNKITASQAHNDSLLATLQKRFEKNPHRHPHLSWSKIAAHLASFPEKLLPLHQMELTGGEPDVIHQNPKTGECLFVDCSPETPRERTSVCYDREGWQSRKEHRPKTNAMDLAAEMGVDLLNEEEYLHLQTLGEFDTKTSSWIKTPSDIRELGGALYGDRRYNRVFIGHNGAQSYYSARGFRAKLIV